MAKYTIEEYDSEPVFFCKECLSLGVRGMDDQDYCDDCGSTEIGETDIESWAKGYAEAYGEDKVLRHISIFKAQD